MSFDPKDLIRVAGEGEAIKVLGSRHLDMGNSG